jgi:hypothetical protein
MPAQRHTAPPRTTPQRIAAARIRQLEELYTAIDTPHAVGVDSHSTRCEAVRDGIILDSLLGSLDHHATVVLMTDKEGVRETLTVLHTLKTEQRVASVMYEVQVDGCLAYELQVGARGPWPLWRFAVDVAARAL